MTVMSDYFQRIVARKQGTYFSIHRIKPGGGGAPGVAYQDFALAEKDALAWAKSGYDVYLAMGAQQACEPNGTAIRKKENTVAARCLYMDVDVKDKAYGSTKEAAAACQIFLKQASLPQPTVVVKSGSGGLHVYWTLSELITPDEHHKLSDQLSLAARESDLKFDSGCTVDLVRLLRIPDTSNYKHNPAQPVNLIHAGVEIDIDVMRRALSRFARMPPRNVFKRETVNDDLRAGATFQLATIDQVAEHCPFIKETLDNGGSNLDNEPQWHDMAALSCHVVDPSPTMHRFCEKNQYYNHDDTEKKLEQAQAYRAQNPTLGPPKCVTLQGNGALHCATCPHLARNTTPLALPFLINGYAYLSDLPSGYFRDDDDCICTDEKSIKSNRAERIKVFPYPLRINSGFLEGKRLTFTTVIGSREEIEVSFDTAIFADNVSFHKAFLHEYMAFTTDIPRTRAFFMSYIKLLRSNNKTMIRVPALGWEKRNGIWGFAFAEEFVTPQGKFPCERPRNKLADYRVEGDIAIWRDMAKMVLTKDRPDLMVLAASAFAAPLVKLSGQHGYLLGAWSSASGIGKTTALTLAQAVWAYPVLGGFSDTVSYTFSKCAEIRNLPVIYDEVKGKTQMENFINLVFAMTSGREKGRSDRSGQMRETRTWDTNICYATNQSIVSKVADDTQGTHASVYRIFEFEALNLPNANLTSEMAVLTTQLSFNYGGAGRIYAEHLGKKHSELSKNLLEYQMKLEQDLNASNAERCWIAAISTILYGAQIAVQLGLAPFDIPVMYKFMVKEFNRMRNDQRMSVMDYTNSAAVYNELSIFLNECERNTIFTDKAWTQPKKPPANYAKIIRHQHQMQEIGIQVSGDPLTIRIRESFFGKWCEIRRRHKTALLEAFVKMAHAQRGKSRLASGTSEATSQETIIIIPATNTPLEGEYLTRFKDLKP
jgi:hypothetical protein